MTEEDMPTPEEIEHEIAALEEADDVDITTDDVEEEDPEVEVED
jgi:hypothetical protein